MSVDSNFVNRFYLVNKKFLEIDGIVDEIIKFQKSWLADEFLDFVKIKSSCDDAKVEIEKLKKKMFRNKKKIVIFGSTSSGKSTFINALFNQDILPSGNGRTTKNIIEIQSSSTNESYIQTPSGKKFKLSEMRDVMKSVKENEKLELFLSATELTSSNVNLLNGDIAIYDTPGIDTSEKVELEVEKICQEADVIMCTVQCESALSRLLKDFIRRFKTKFTKFNIYLVFNMADRLDESGYQSTIQDHIKDGIEFLEEFMSKDEAKKHVSIISAKEMVNEDCNSPYALERKRSFERLNRNSLVLINDTIINGRWSYLDELFLVLRSISSQCKNELSSFEYQSNNFGNHLLENLSKFGDLNPMINEQITKAFQEAYEVFLRLAIDTVKSSQDEESKSKGDNNSNADDVSLISVTSNNVVNRLNDLLDESVENALKATKVLILEKHWESSIDEWNNISMDDTSCTTQSNGKESIHKKIDMELKESSETLNDVDKPKTSVSSNDSSTSKQKFLCETILEQLYFPLYFDVSREMQMFNMENLMDSLKKILKVIKDGKIGTIVTTTVLGAAAIASGGALIPIIAPIEATIAAVGGMATAGMAVGAGIGSGTSFGVLQSISLPFRPFWSKEEENIKGAWVPIEAGLKNSYCKFIEDIETNVNHLIFPLIDKCRDIDIRLDNYQNTLKRERNNET